MSAPMLTEMYELFHDGGLAWTFTKDQDTRPAYIRPIQRLRSKISCQAGSLFTDDRVHALFLKVLEDPRKLGRIEGNLFARTAKGIQHILAQFYAERQNSITHRSGARRR
jgi:hypothetical protein